MLNFRRLAAFLATGVVPERTALDESLEEHDRKYHPDGYREGDSCNKRETMAGGDGVDIEVKKRGEGEQRNCSSSERGNGVTAEEDAAYLAAVERGDMETARRMVREAAARAMPETKVVDEDGLPMVVWHGGTFTSEGYVANLPMHFGTKAAAEDRLDDKFPFRDKSKSNNTGSIRLVSCYLNIKQPIRTGDTLNWIKKIETAKKQGYDGIIYKNRVEGGRSDSWIAFKPSQIKSADPVTYDDAGQPIPLSRRFDFSSDDIRY